MGASSVARQLAPPSLAQRTTNATSWSRSWNPGSLRIARRLRPSTSSDSGRRRCQGIPGRSNRSPRGMSKAALNGLLGPRHQRPLSQRPAQLRYPSQSGSGQSHSRIPLRQEIRTNAPRSVVSKCPFRGPSPRPARLPLPPPSRRPRPGPSGTQPPNPTQATPGNLPTPNAPNLRFPVHGEPGRCPRRPASNHHPWRPNSPSIPARIPCPCKAGGTQLAGPIPQTGIAQIAWDGRFNAARSYLYDAVLTQHCRPPHQWKV